MRKVGFFQKVLMLHLAFPQTVEPCYFLELEFWNCKILKGSNHAILGPEVVLKVQIRLNFAIWAFRATSGSYLTWFEPFEISHFQKIQPRKITRFACLRKWQIHQYLLKQSHLLSCNKMTKKSWTLNIVLCHVSLNQKIDLYNTC